MRLQLTNVGLAPISIKDQEGYTDFSVTVDPATTKNVDDVSTDLLSRLTPYLKTLETPVLDANGNALVELRWAVSAYDGDVRMERAGLAGLPDLVEAQIAGYSTGSGNVDAVFTGTGLLGGQTKATHSVTIEGVTGQLDLEAVTPGSAGNDISIELVAPSSTLAVTVTGSKISIRPASGGSTVAAIAAAINGDSDALLLVQASEGVAGTFNAAVAEANLSGGEGPGVTLSINGVYASISALSDTEITATLPLGESTATYHVALDYRCGPHTSRLMVPVVA